MEKELKEKLDRLSAILKKNQKVLIAYSGGLDSGFLLWASIKSLGPNNVFAAVGLSPSYASGEREDATKFASEIGLPQSALKFIETHEFENPGYLANNFDRCFHCKNELYGKLTALAGELGCDTVADGFNQSDVGDFRPGHEAASKLGVISPLAEAGLSKDDIINLAAIHSLSLADKPASACLASRIPFGSPVTVEKLAQIDKAETEIKKLGFTGFRVRHHGEIARLEMRPQDIARIAEAGLKEKVAAIVKAAGFKYVTLDLDGYRQGTFNPDRTSNKKGESL